MNFISNSLKIYIHTIFIMIYLQMKCFRNSPTFCYNFNSLHYARKKLYIYNDNLLRFCILSFKISLRTLKNVVCFESYLKFKKILKFGHFLQ